MNKTISLNNLKLKKVFVNGTVEFHANVTYSDADNFFSNLNTIGKSAITFPFSHLIGGFVIAGDNYKTFICF